MTPQKITLRWDTTEVTSFEMTVDVPGPPGLPTDNLDRLIAAVRHGVPLYELDPHLLADYEDNDIIASVDCTDREITDITILEIDPPQTTGNDD